MTALMERPARPARLLVTPDLIERQVERLTDWSVQTDDPRVLAAVEAMVPGSAIEFGCLCDAAEALVELESGTYDFDARPWWDRDPDKVEAAFRADYAELLGVVYDGAWVALTGGAR